MSAKTLLILALGLVPVAAMVLAGVMGWGIHFPNTQFAVAFALGATATVLLSVGLFALTFLSSRRGFDERARDEQTKNEQDSDGA
jgi:NhaP-type Na+/H+ or K+/H+ antiporter